jgi:hypothetical protein
MTTIRLQDETAHNLKALGLRGDSYDKTIAMLIDSFKKCDPRYKAIEELRVALEGQ